MFVNRTIDDTYGDSVTGRLPIYGGLGWNDGPNCPGCGLQPSREATFMKTWHDTTSHDPSDAVPHTVGLLFNGTAIWVYCIIPNDVAHGVTTFVNMTIALDGEVVGHYSHVSAANSDTYNYNVTIYNNTGLANTQHLLQMTAMQDSQASVILFDWAEYTYDDGLEESRTTSTVAVSTSIPVIASVTSLSKHGTTTSTNSRASSSASNVTYTSQVAGIQSSSQGSLSRATIIGLSCGIGSAVLALITILYILLRRRAQNVASRDVGNNELAGRHLATIVDPFVDQSLADQYMPGPPAVSTMAQWIPISSASPTSTTMHGTACGFPVTVSVTAPATVGDNETVQPDALEEAREQERYDRHIRKYRDQVAELRRLAELSRGRLAAFAPNGSGFSRV